MRRQPVDRVPISTYELNGYNPASFENRTPSYRRLMDKIRAETDCIYMWGWDPWRESEHWENRVEVQSDGSTVTYRRLRTPKGDLTKTTRVMPGIHTVWTTEHLLKGPEDLDRYLSVLPELFQIGDDKVAAARASYAQAEDRVGEHGVVMSSGGDPSAFVPDLFEFGLFTLMCFQYKDKILELIDALTPPVLEVYHVEAEYRFGTIHRLCGPEYFTPPYLPAEYYREMVLPGCAAAARILDEAGIFLRLHSHGRIRDSLPVIVEMGAKGTDPCEAPPDGDISLREMKAQYGDRLILFGNTELKMLETAEAETIDAMVKQQMDDAKDGGGYILMPTAAPINEPLAPQTEQNYFAWIDAGLKYGGY